MQFMNGLRDMLIRHGYENIQGTDGLCWRLRDQGEMAIIQLVPEQLPGQTRIPLADRDRWGRELERQQMLVEGCRTDRLMLVLISGPPSEEEIQELEAFPAAWYLDKTSGTVYLYEHQRGDFHHLRDWLETFAEEYFQKKKEYDRNQFFKALTPVNTSLIAINILVFLFLSLIGNTEDAEFMYRHGALTWDAVAVDGQYYRLISSMFLHFGASHLLQNMVTLAVLGRRLERAVGSWKYLALYFLSGLVSAAASFFFTLAGNPYVICAGASGAIFGVMGGLLALILKSYVTGSERRRSEIGLRGMIFMIVCAISYGFTATDVDNAAHVGGLLAGFVIMLLLDLLPDKKSKKDM